MTPELRLIFWELTARCNLHCRHCRAEAGMVAAGELSTAEVLTALRAIRDDGNPLLILTGGEPLTRADFFDIADTCCELFSRVALATNGTLIDDALAQRILQSGIKRVSISLDGVNASTHDEFRGVAGSFDAAMRGLFALRRVGLSVQINVTASHHNVQEIGALLNLALEVGADAFHLFLLVPVGCGAEIADSMRLSPAAVEELLCWLHATSRDVRERLQIQATCAPQYYRIMHEQRDTRVASAIEHHSSPARTRGCLAGHSVCFISRTGAVQPCGYLPLSAGNIREQTLGEIWRDAELFSNLRDVKRLNGKCGVCDYRSVCGGCRARAYAATGDPFAAEPDCAMIKYDFVSE
jgi:radical SAM protein with 4Fe4S-binding SPASM domain